MIFLVKKSVILKINRTKVVFTIGDIFTESGLKAIPFNEYFDTKVDEKLISSSSLNGIFLKNTGVNLDEFENIYLDDENIQRKLIEENHDRKGKKNRYTLGTSFVFKEYIIVAFSSFDKQNRAYMSYNEYVKCLLHFWQEVDRLHAGRSIVIPLMGAGITRIFDWPDAREQDFFDTILYTFRVSRIKLNIDSELKIVVPKAIYHKINPYRGGYR